nr:MAG TPA: hypothetical protein [Caudoviricetes sp.]
MVHYHKSRLSRITVTCVLEKRKESVGVDNSYTKIYSVLMEVNYYVNQMPGV